MDGESQTCWILPPRRPRCKAYVCFPVDDALAARSPVIETLMDSAGVAELPDGIEMVDFLRWSLTSVDSLPSCHAEDVSQALLVADKMSDTRTEAFAAELAQRLTRADWVRLAQEDSDDSVQRAVLNLDTGLQHLVLKQLRDIKITEVLLWPAPLQQVYVDMLAATSTTGVTLPHAIRIRDTNAILSMLSHAPRSASGLRSLTINRPITSTATAALLCGALLQHAPSLSALHLPALACTGDDETLPHAILTAATRCSRLTALTLSFRGPLQTDSHAATRTLAALAAAVAALPLLADFRLLNVSVSNAATGAPHSGGDGAAAPPLKRQRLVSVPSSPPPPLSLDPVVAALAEAPALTSLTLASLAPVQSHLTPPGVGPPLCNGLTGGFAHLQHLQIGSVRSAAHALWPAYPHSMPLPVSRLSSLTALSLYSCNPSTPPQPCDLARSCEHLLNLRELVLHLDKVPADALGALRGGAVPPLAHLESLVLNTAEVRRTSDICLVVDWIGMQPALTKLEFEVDNMDDNLYNDIPKIVPALRGLAGLVHLRSLSICFGVVCLGGDLIKRAPLTALTGLTSLHLDVQGNGECLLADSLAPVLRAMGGLQHLHAGVLDCPTAGKARACLDRLSALTAIELQLMDFRFGLMRCLGQCMSGMPALQTVAVSSMGHPVGTEEEMEIDEQVDDEEEEGQWDSLCAQPWVYALEHLPGWGKYTFDIRCGDIPCVDMDRFRRLVQARGAVVSQDCSEVTFPPPGCAAV